MGEPIPISAHPAVVRRAGEKLNAAISEAIKKGAPMTIPEPPHPVQGGEWVMVPKEPTEAMVEACENALAEWRKTLNADERILRSRMQDGRMLVSAAPREKHAIRYRAMIAASPTPPLGGEGR